MSDARADALIYRCGTSICRAAPDGSAKTRLTRDGGTHTWVSASRNGKRLAVVRSTFTRVLDGHGKALTGDLPRGGTAVIAEIAPDASRLATVALLPEIAPAPVGSPPGSPGISGLQPYLFAMAPDGSGRDSVARDPTFDLYNPAFDRGRIAVVRSSAETGTGPIVVYRNGTVQRTVTAGAAAQPSWSPDGRRIAYERGGRIYVGKRRVLKGRQPVWTTAPACRNRVGLRLRGRSAIVTACAPQPGRLTVTLRSDGRRVARRTVQTPTGRLVKIRFHRPAGRVSAAAHFSSRRRSGSA